jgi:hypothetical protein
MQQQQKVESLDLASLTIPDEARLRQQLSGMPLSTDNTINYGKGGRTQHRS